MRLGLTCGPVTLNSYLMPAYLVPANLYFFGSKCIKHTFFTFKTKIIAFFRYFCGENTIVWRSKAFNYKENLKYGDMSFLQRYTEQMNVQKHSGKIYTYHSKIHFDKYYFYCWYVIQF